MGFGSRTLNAYLLATVFFFFYVCIMWRAYIVDITDFYFIVFEKSTNHRSSP